jgi:hypothetical protein
VEALITQILKLTLVVTNGAGRDTPTNSACWRRVMSILPLVIPRGSTNLAFLPLREGGPAQGNVSVDVLLPPERSKCSGPQPASD